MTSTLIPERQTERRLTLLGLLGALLGPVTGLIGTAVALVIAVVLGRRGERRPAATLVLVAVLAVVLLYAFATPVGVEEVID